MWKPVTDKIILYCLFAAYIPFLGFIFWKAYSRVKNGFLVVEAYRNYQGRYSSYRESELIVIIMNPTWSKSIEILEIIFFDESRNELFRVSQEGGGQKPGVSTGLDYGALEGSSGHRMASKYVKVITSRNLSYEATIKVHSWVHDLVGLFRG